MLTTYSEKWNLSPEILMKNLFLTIYLHDIGKITQKFQERIKQNKRSQIYPHAFFGFPIAFEIFKIQSPSIIPVDGYPLIEPLTILSHHTQLYKTIYLNSTIRNPNLLQKEVLNFLNKIPEAYTDLKFNRFFPLKFNKIETLKVFNFFNHDDPKRNIQVFIHPLNGKSIRDIVENIEDLDSISKLKSIYTLFLSITRFCDFYSSAHFSDYVTNYLPETHVLDSVLYEPEKYVTNIPSVTQSQILKNNSPFQYQDEMSQNAHPYTFLFAPCGRGKTEAALLWANSICKKMNKNRILFAMPTQTTSNAMMDTFIKLLDNSNLPGKEFIGLYHGKSFVKLKEDQIKERKEIEESDKLDENDIEELKEETFKGKIFYKSITITTIDHLILSFLHGFSQADFSCGNLQNSVIIFDEIHYYERQTLSHLIDLFVILRKMGIPHLLMSGTLPDFIIQTINNTNKENVTYFLNIDGEGIHFTPFTIELFDFPLIENEHANENVIEDIVENFQKGFNQFIIFNTVRRAQKFYAKIIEQIDTESIHLLHSQFTYSDRNLKEAKVIKLIKEEKKRPLIVISTQVIEISLDITCDIMYSELAPIDAIGQRAGRLHRGEKSYKENEHEYTLKIYLPENHLPYDPKILEKTKDNLENGIYSYQKLKEICDIVYGADYLKEFKENNLLEGSYGFLESGGKKSLFKKTYLFGPHYRNIVYSEEKGNHFLIRTKNQLKIDVIPEKNYGYDPENLKVEKQAKIPLWWLLLDRKVHGDELQWFEIIKRQFKYKTKLFCICKLPYTEEYGFNNEVIEEENKKNCIFENII
jgi:CRISPR-associated endonuclease/helicase Cas3